MSEHLHIQGEDALLHHTERDGRVRIALDGFIIALLIGVAIFVAGVLALMLI